jgi:hypothetical protein
LQKATTSTPTITSHFPYQSSRPERPGCTSLLATAFENNNNNNNNNKIMHMSMQEDDATSEASRDQRATEAYLNGPYVIRNFTSVEEYGEYIKEEDVVRPMNRRWVPQAGAETSIWRHKSAARCPTYGNCRFCLMAGPVGRRCSECNDPKKGYAIMFNGPPGETKLLDSITLADMFGKLFQRARSDYRSQPHMQKLHSFERHGAHECAEKMYEHIQDPVEKKDLIEVKMVQFKSFLEE